MDKVLVMGIGNLLLTDDGVGVHAAQTLAGESWPENVTIMEAGTFTQDVFYLFKGFAHVLILDIVHGHAGPGTVYRLSESQLVDNEKQRLSIHDIDLLDSLRMAEMLHGSRPRLTVMGMEPADYVLEHGAFPGRAGTLPPPIWTRSAGRFCACPANTPGTIRHYLLTIEEESCLAIPAQVVELQEQGMARVRVGESQTYLTASMLLLPEPPRVGDYVIVHAGFALHSLTPEQAQESLAAPARGGRGHRRPETPVLIAATARAFPQESPFRHPAAGMGSRRCTPAACSPAVRRPCRSPSLPVAAAFGPSGKARFRRCRAALVPPAAFSRGKAGQGGLSCRPFA